MRRHSPVFTTGATLALIASVLLLQVSVASPGRAEPADDLGRALATADAVDPGTAALIESSLDENGVVRVIVSLPTPVSLEAELGAAASGRQRRRIARDQQELLGAITDGAVSVIHDLVSAPVLVLELTRDGVIDVLRSGRAESLVVDEPLGLVNPSHDADSPLLDGSDGLIQAALVKAAGFDGSGTNVAILDTGVDRSHPFFSDGAGGSRVIAEACFSGFVTSSSITSLCPGGGKSQEGTGAGNDCDLVVRGCGHGTHVAGIAAGTPVTIGSGGYAGIDVEGVAPGAGIIAVQVFTRFDSEVNCGAGGAPCVLTYGGDQMAALDWLFDNLAERPVASINMSIGGSRNTSACAGDLREPLIAQLRAAGVAVVIAAGNNGWSDAVTTPGCTPSSVTVGSTTKADIVASYSNTHPTMVDLYAPGSSILSSLPGPSWARYNGTSMAAPQVAGVFALLRDRFPDATVGTLLEALQETGVQVGDREGGTAVGFSRPRVRANDARLTLEGTSALTVSLTGADTGVVVSDPAGISCPPTCSVEIPEGDGATFDLTATATSLSSQFAGWGGGTCSGTGTCTITVSGLATVTARFDAGVPSNDSFANSVELAVGNPAETLVTSAATVQEGEPSTCGTLPIGKTVWFHIVPPAAGRAVIDTVGSSFDTVIGASTGAAVGAQTLVGDCNDGTAEAGWTDSTVAFDVVAGTRYYVRAGGYGGAHGTLLVNLALDMVPSTPATPDVTRGDSSALVVASPPDDNGAEIRGYEAQCAAAGRPTRSVSGSSATLTVASLVNGVSYACSVRAGNAVGWSAWSAGRSVVPAGAPNAPRAPVLARGARSARASFAAPAANGAAVTSYQVSCTARGKPTRVSSSAASPVTVRSLAKGTRYSCAVRARNAVGWSSWSPSRTVVPK